MWARLLLRQASRRRTVPIAPEETVSGLLLEQLRRLRLKTLTTRARRDDCGPRRWTPVRRLCKRSMDGSRGNTMEDVLGHTPISWHLAC